ncbi:hypothetical protein GF324_09265 [bacterium]|nr:hypothetical protein [bacterium]
MSLIAISRGTKSGGVLLAEAVGSRMGAEILSKDRLVQEAGMEQLEADIWEQIKDRPVQQLDGTLRLSRRQYYANLRAKLLEYAAAEGMMVYHGNGSHLLLHDISCVLRVRLVAPIAVRVKLILDRLGGDEGEAIRYIHEKDEVRIKWTRFLYGLNNIDSPLSYDLIINLDRFTIELAADLVVKAVGMGCFRGGEERIVSLKNALTRARIEAALVNDARTEKLQLKVKVDGGRVTLVASDLTDPQLRDVTEIVQSVEGVYDVEPLPGV